MAAAAGVWLAYRLVDIFSEAMARKASRTATRFDDLLVPLISKSAKVFITAFGLVFIAGNLNISFNFVEGESLIMALRDLAVSSGSACTSASLEPSYVLRALGRNDELAHSSIRFTIGRFTTVEEIDYTVELVRAAVEKLRDLSPLWDMYKDGVDLNSVEWVAH